MLCLVIDYHGILCLSFFIFCKAMNSLSVHALSLTWHEASVSHIKTPWVLGYCALFINIRCVKQLYIMVFSRGRILPFRLEVLISLFVRKGDIAREKMHPASCLGALLKQTCCILFYCSLLPSWPLSYSCRGTKFMLKTG